MIHNFLSLMALAQTPYNTPLLASAEQVHLLHAAAEFNPCHSEFSVFFAY